MALLDEVKKRLGVLYSDPIKDADIGNLIEEAKQYFKNAGWKFDDGDKLGLGAISLYVKMAQSTDPTVMKNHPVLISYIAQGRADKK